VDFGYNEHSCRLILIELIFWAALRRVLMTPGIKAHWDLSRCAREHFDASRSWYGRLQSLSVQQ
jgi:hypothetical protein